MFVRKNRVSLLLVGFLALCSIICYYCINNVMMRTSAMAEISDVIEVQNSPSSGISETINMQHPGTYQFENITYIDNWRYFRTNPQHAVNDGHDNASGTCTTVAMQLLMGYYNYYSERRLIPEFGENGQRFLSADYAKLEEHPKLKLDTVSDMWNGRDSIGTQTAFYEEIFNLTPFSGNESFGQSMPLVVSGTKNFIYKYDSAIADTVTIDWGFYSKEFVKAKIDGGQPIALGMTPLGSGEEKNYHVVVAYGYATVNDVFGYIVHWGWHDGQVQIWVPSNYFGFMLYMQIGHEHKLNYVNTIGNAYIEYHCETCGCDLVEDIYGLDESGDTITTVYLPQNIMTVPDMMYGKWITGIENNAFLGCEELETITISDNIDFIGDQAFAGCANLHTVFCKSVEPPTVGQDIFMGLTPDENFAIYVPYRVQDVYKAAFGSYAEFVKSYPVEVQLISDGDIVERLNWYDGMIIEGLTEPPKTGYTFGGWYDSPEYEGTAYQDGDILESQTNITLYAKWTANQYTITMDPKNGEAKSTEDVEFGKPFKLSVPTWEGHVFEGWRDTNGVLITTKSGDSFEPWNRAENIEVYADWRIELYCIKVEEDGKTIAWLGPKGFSDEQEGIAYGTKLVAINLIQIFKESKYGYKEGEIFYNFQCLDEIIHDGRVGDLGSDGCVVVIKPQWKPEKHSIHLHTQRDLVVPTIQEFYGKPITLPTISLLGETFEGWFTESVGGKKVEWDHMPDLTPNEQNNGSCDLFAHWTRNTYTVEYNPNGGAGTMASTKFYYGESHALRKNTFTKYGHEFIGWATSSSGGVVYADEAKVPDLTKENNATIKLFAVWKACVYDIVYLNLMPDMVVLCTTYTYGEGVTKIPDPRRVVGPNGVHESMDRFYGWYYDYKFTQPVTSISKTQTGTVMLCADYEYWVAGTYAGGTRTVTDDGIDKQPSITVKIPIKSQYLDQIQQNPSLSIVRVELSMNIWEVNDGYQQLYLYAGDTAIWSKELEHGAGKKNTTPQTYTFNISINISKLRNIDELVFRFSARGVGADTWQFDNFKVDMYFTD